MWYGMLYAVRLGGALIVSFFAYSPPSRPLGVPNAYPAREGH